MGGGGGGCGGGPGMHWSPSNTSFPSKRQGVRACPKPLTHCEGGGGGAGGAGGSGHALEPLKHFISK